MFDEKLRKWSVLSLLKCLGNVLVNRFLLRLRYFSWERFLYVWFIFLISWLDERFSVWSWFGRLSIFGICLEKLLEWRFKIFKNILLSFWGKGLDSIFCERFRVFSWIRLFIKLVNLFFSLLLVSLRCVRLDRLKMFLGIFFERRLCDRLRFVNDVRVFRVLGNMVLFNLWLLKLSDYIFVFWFWLM